MTTSNEEPTPSAQQFGEALASQIGEREWQLDVDPVVEEIPPEPPAPRKPRAAKVPATLEPSAEIETPPSPGQIIEALLFIGGSALTAEQAGKIIRGLNPVQFRESIDDLNRLYRAQQRPYTITGGEQGYSLTIRPRFRPLRERIFGGPREARLTQAALDALSLIAYRQPISKPELDASRGYDSSSPLRQLVRLGLVTVVQRGEAGHQDVRYGTTARFLDLFGLRNLEDLPQIGEPQRI